METIFYTLDASELTVYGRASGDGAPQTRLYPRARSGAAPTGGVVLDLEAYRRRAGEFQRTEAVPLVPDGRKQMPRRGRLELALDLCASAAVVVMAAVVVALFLPLL